METTRLTLLIVDDEERPRASVKFVFQDSYHVLLAESGETALKLLREHPVDVAILDILMAGMSGPELLAKIKEFDPTVEVIMLTAYETVQTARHAVQHGASDYLNKPFDVPTIRAAVQNAFKKRQLALARKSAQADLLRLKNELEDLVLKEKMTRTKGEIYANILHDIHNPLSVINLYMDVLARSLQDPENFSEEHQKTLQAEMDCIKSEVKHCFNISQRYLGYLRQPDDEADYASINQALLDVEKMLKQHPALKGNKIQITKLPTDAQAAIHSIDLLQILLNLTTNALQSTPAQHEIRIAAQLLTGTPDPSIWKQDAQNRFVTGITPSAPPRIALSISDNGPGIEPQILDRIFDAQITTKSATEGTGLGFTIIKRLIEAAGGAIHIHTELGVGTTCTLYLN